MTCTTQILVVLLIGCAAREFSFNQTEALPRSGQCTSSVWNFGARYLDVILRGLKSLSSGDLAKRRLFSQAICNHETVKCKCNVTFAVCNMYSATCLIMLSSSVALQVAEKIVSCNSAFIWNLQTVSRHFLPVLPSQTCF